MLASTIQFPNNNPVTPTTTRTPPEGRNSYGLGHARDNPEKTTPHPRTRPKGHAGRRGLLFQDPTVCQKTIHPMGTTVFQPASERTNDNNHNMNSHYLLIFHP
jgi:hypothetical protein